MRRNQLGFSMLTISRSTFSRLQTCASGRNRLRPFFNAVNMSSYPAPPDFASRWNKLIEACLGGRLMPFLGAGVSIYANLGGDDRAPHYKDNMPATGILTAQILFNLQSSDKLPDLPTWAKAELERITGPINCPNKNPSFADAAQLFIDLHRDGEHGLFENGGPLDIRLFLSVQPTLAHRALAWLVRENLFSEVVTTNYDCALETAFAQSFGKHSAKNEIFHAISNHTDYREKSPRAQRSHEGASVPVLRVYKINGCARRYHDKRVRGDAKQTTQNLGPGFLVITDRHLQDFGRRQWAQDLFRDRFRSRQIVFSGFGAEEPQIRFTALRVIEEFAEAKEPTSPSTAGVDPHCFLQCFGSDLSASQLQIAKAACGHLGATPDPTPSIFTGSDLAEFSRSPANQGLSASLFWRRVHRDVAARLIERRLERCEFFSWLRERDHLRPLCYATAHGLRRRLRDAGTDAPSAWLAGFLELDPDVENTLRLMVLVSRARNPAAVCPSGYYEELDRGDSLPIKLLYLFHLLDLDANKAKVIDSGLWLPLHRPCPDGQPPTPPRWIFVTTRPPRQPPSPPVAGVRLATCLILCPTSNDPEERRPAFGNSSVVTWHFITLLECLSKVARDAHGQLASDSLRRALLDSHAPRPRPSFYESARHR
jgi:hypothetical protein